VSSGASHGCASGAQSLVGGVAVAVSAARVGLDDAAQVCVLVDAYGLAHAERGAVVDAILERQTRNARFWAEIRSGWASAIATDEQITERIAWSRREHWHTVVNRGAFEVALHDQAR
jgi:alpha-D-ribose 1-methylphosphonate 5-triphosphate synthase subunit PhnG